MQGTPRMCTGITALACGVIFFSKSIGSIVSELSTSAITGIAFAANIAAQEAKKVYPGTITSSPGPTPTATRAVSYTHLDVYKRQEIPFMIDF